jgi:hypothetical protein
MRRAPSRWVYCGPVLLVGAERANAVWGNGFSEGWDGEKPGVGEENHGLRARLWVLFSLLTSAPHSPRRSPC